MLDRVCLPPSHNVSTILIGKSTLLHAIFTCKAISPINNKFPRHDKHLFPCSSSNTTCQLQILGHDGNSLSVNRTQIGIFKESHQMRFRSLLKGQNGSCLPAKGNATHGHLNFSHQPSKGKFANEQIGGALKFANLAECSFA